MYIPKNHFLKNLVQINRFFFLCPVIFYLYFICPVATNCLALSLITSISSLLQVPSKLGRSYVCSSSCTPPHSHLSSSDKLHLNKYFLVRPIFALIQLNVLQRFQGRVFPLCSSSFGSIVTVSFSLLSFVCCQPL